MVFGKIPVGKNRVDQFVLRQTFGVRRRLQILVRDMKVAVPQVVADCGLRFENPKIMSRDEWLAARKELLAKEKRLTHERDAIAAERRQLPWGKVEKTYVFDSPGGKKTLADLFDGKSQLIIIYHFMFGAEWNEGCPSCSFNMDHTDAVLVHLAQRDVSFTAISRAPYPKIAAFSWRFNWVSSNGNDFNRDHHVAFTGEELAKGAVDYNYGHEQIPKRGGSWD